MASVVVVVFEVVDVSKVVEVVVGPGEVATLNRLKNNFFILVTFLEIFYKTIIS